MSAKNDYELDEEQEEDVLPTVAPQNLDETKKEPDHEENKDNSQSESSFTTRKSEEIVVGEVAASKIFTKCIIACFAGGFATFGIITYYALEKLLPQKPTNSEVLEPPLLSALPSEVLAIMRENAIAILTVLTLLSLVAYYHARYQHEINCRAMEKYAASILEEVKRRGAPHIDPEEGLVHINKLRDELIPARQLKTEIWKWNEAVRHIKETDQRIRCLTVTLNGEECLTMEWIGDIETIKDANGMVDTSY